jgi:hypothetical protein
MINITYRRTLIGQEDEPVGTVDEASIELFNLHSMFIMKQELRVNEPNTFVLATTVGLETGGKRTTGMGR